jgi:uncharacterized protein involved in type VI secretion and phage assembly
MEETVVRLAQYIDQKRFGKFRAIVIDNQDPEKRARLRLRVPSVLADQESDWALPCLPYGGIDQQGMFFVPEIDAQVWVEFEEGDINKPIWVGTFWQQQSDTPEDAAKDEPTTRLIQTKSGHILQFDDEAGEERFRLYHPKDAEMIIDKNGSISLTDTSGAVLKMDAESSVITVEDANGNTMTMNSSGTKVEDSNGNVIEMSAAGITAEAPKIVLEGGQVHLGGEGGEPVIKGQSFLSMFATHIHTVAPVVGGPTSPPIPQGEMSTLSTTVKTI